MDSDGRGSHLHSKPSNDVKHLSVSDINDHLSVFTGLVVV